MYSRLSRLLIDVLSALLVGHIARNSRNRSSRTYVPTSSMVFRSSFALAIVIRSLPPDPFGGAMCIHILDFGEVPAESEVVSREA